MVVTVKLFATLTKGRFVKEEREYPDGATPFDIMKDLGISDEDAAIIFVNSVHAEKAQGLSHGDTVAFFPPVGGG